MKISHKKRNLLAGAVGLIVLIAIGILVDVLLHEHRTSAPKESTIEQSIGTDQTSAQAPKPITITLPGAEPVPALDGDYSQDSSLWRLVNKSYPLTNMGYRPEITKPNVPTRTDKSLDEQSVHVDIVPAVEELFTAAQTAGFELQIGSGFRGAEQQKTYYDNYSRVYGQAAADTVSAKPGHSEHQTGLAIDLTTIDHYCYLEACFGDTAAGKWLAANAHNYGFVLRYPLGKEAVTGYNYEPWHFRYVGNHLAAALHESGLTLEEAAPYLEIARLQLMEQSITTEQ